MEKGQKKITSHYNPSDKTVYNQITNGQKTKLRKAQNTFYT